MYNTAPGAPPEGDSCPPLPPSRDRVYARTRQLALTAGRYAHQISKSDYDQAMREITGQSDPKRQEAILEAAERLRLARVAKHQQLTAGSAGRQPPAPRNSRH
ncbi:hypothetical protein [Haloferula sp. BvORR071]|uniref:hypothetical protein n=1 Tax=Haloferula sp. BvORR071 TaxID=1396141 RepID=UPI002240F34D|nr:hypothetical protein [Haloferula sp. BvORR071]